jgi:hypothetical protein
VGDFEPGTLDLAYQSLLGIADARAVTTLPWSTAPVATTLEPAFATTGTRGLRFQDPVSGDTFFAEYRPGTGQDAATYYASFLGSPFFLAWPTGSGLVRKPDFTPGVRLYRLDPEKNDLATMTVPKGDLYDATLAPGETFKPASAGFTVAVTAEQPGTSARVVVTLAERATSTVAVAVPAVTYGKAATVTIKVAAARTVTGPATVSVDGVQRGTATLSAGSATFRPPSTVSAGTHKVTVTYGGSATVAPSTGTAVLSVAKARAQATVASMSTLKRGARAKVTIKLTGVGAQAPTGQVRLRVGTTYVTGRHTVTKVGTAWTATMTTTRLPVGGVRIVYSGNANLLGTTYLTGRVVR